MSNVVEQLLSMALGAAGTASFAWEKKGPFIAAGLTVVDGIMQAIFGITQPKPDPMQHFATRQDLQNVFRTLENDLKAHSFKEMYHNRLVSVETMQNSYQETFADLLANKGFGAETSLVQGYNALQKSEQSAWITYYNDLCDPIYKPNTDIKTLLIDFGDATSPTFFKTLGLFCTTVGLFVNYCQLIMWVNFAKLNLALKAEGQQNSPAAPAGQNVLPKSFLDMTGYPEASEMDDKLKEAIAVLEPVLAKREQAFAQFAAAVKKQDQDLIVKKGGGGWIWTDKSTGTTSQKAFPTQQAATWARDAKLSSETPAIKATFEKKFPVMVEITDSMAQNYNQILTNWKKTRADYAARCADHAKAVAKANAPSNSN